MPFGEHYKELTEKLRANSSGQCSWKSFLQSFGNLSNVWITFLCLPAPKPCTRAIPGKAKQHEHLPFCLKNRACKGSQPENIDNWPSTFNHLFAARLKDVKTPGFVFTKRSTSSVDLLGFSSYIWREFKVEDLQLNTKTLNNTPVGWN